MITKWENSSILIGCDNPGPEGIRHALDNKQVLWRYKNKRVQVLAQTLSNYLDTRTSSLLAVNKKQGVPEKFIHREWKRTWVDLEGLKVRVNHTEHGSALLKGLKQVIENLDAYKTAYKRRPIVEEPQESANASAASGVSNASNAPKPEQKHKPVKPCDLAVEANTRAVHNTERLNKLDRQVHDVDKQTTQATVNQTLLGELNTRVGRLASQADRLDTKTDGLVSRVSVLEDTNKWLSWTLAGVIGVRFLNLMLRMLKRK